MDVATHILAGIGLVCVLAALFYVGVAISAFIRWK